MSADVVRLLDAAREPVPEAERLQVVDQAGTIAVLAIIDALDQPPTTSGPSQSPLAR